MKSKCFSLLLLFLFSLVSIGAYAQVKVEGSVFDETDNPLIGVSVFTEGRKTGTVQCSTFYLIYAPMLTKENRNNSSKLKHLLFILLKFKIRNSYFHFVQLNLYLLKFANTGKVLWEHGNNLSTFHLSEAITPHLFYSDNHTIPDIHYL